MLKSALFDAPDVLGNYNLFQIVMAEAVPANALQRVPQPHVLEATAFIKGLVFQTLQLLRSTQVRVSQATALLKNAGFDTLDTRGENQPPESALRETLFFHRCQALVEPRGLQCLFGVERISVNGRHRPREGVRLRRIPAVYSGGAPVYQCLVYRNN